MALKTLDSINGMHIISQDAFDIGEIVDIRYDPTTWDIVGFKVKSNKSVAGLLNAGSGKSMIMIKPDQYIINDVMLFQDTLEDARSRISADNGNIPSLSYITGKKIVTSDGILLGSVDEVLFDSDRWSVISLKVKLDKVACPLLGLKKGLFAKMAYGLLVRHIVSVSENVNLYLTMEELKDELAFD
ncbi:MAG: hypothetical protein WCR96_04495 [Candidatus Methanomethylophilaceae archaeon]